MALSSSQECPASVPKACAGLLQGSASSPLRERLQTGAWPSSWSRRTRLQNQLYLADGFGLGVEDDLSVGDLGSEILKGPKDKFPEEGNMLFCGIKQRRGS